MAMDKRILFYFKAAFSYTRVRIIWKRDLIVLKKVVHTICKILWLDILN